MGGGNGGWDEKGDAQIHGGGFLVARNGVIGIPGGGNGPPGPPLLVRRGPVGFEVGSVGFPGARNKVNRISGGQKWDHWGSNGGGGGMGSGWDTTSSVLNSIRVYFCVQGSMTHERAAS